MNLPTLSPPLLWSTLVFALVAGVLLLLLPTAGPLVGGQHRVLKPMKFAGSCALLTGALAIMVPLLSATETDKTLAAYVISVTLGIEVLFITLQALRGTKSHYNFTSTLNIVIWRTMVTAIVVFTFGIIYVAYVAVRRPLLENGSPIDPAMALAWRAGILLLQLVAVTGFAMGARKRYSVGGDDGGQGMKFTNWSKTHGDLRVTHFVSVHGIQIIPLLAWMLAKAEVAEPVRVGAVLVTSLVFGAVGIFTLAQAISGRPLRRARV